MASAIGPSPIAAGRPAGAIRSFISVVIAMRHPRPGAPSTLVLGTRTSVRKTSLNPDSPVI